MSQVLGAFGLLDFTMLRPVRAWRVNEQSAKVNTKKNACCFLREKIKENCLVTKCHLRPLEFLN
jgi:hypothetical protein